MDKTIDDESIILTIYRLKDVFDRTDNPEQAAAAVKQIIGDVNIVDPSEREGSIWRNRPLHMVLNESVKAEKTPRQQKRDEEFAKITQMAANGTLPPKDWNAKPSNPLPKKDWSKLGR